MPINYPQFNPLTPSQMGAPDIAQAVGQGTSVVDAMIGARLKEMQAASKQQEIEAGLPFATANYKNAMSNYLMGAGSLKGLSPLGKTLVEPFIVNKMTGAQIPNPKYDPSADYQPTGNAVQDSYNLARLKATTDYQTRQRNLYANNIEKTLDTINPDDLSYGSGLVGGMEYAKDAALAPLGKQSDRYDKYKEAENSAHFLASQVRQFYGDSIQPEMRHRLDMLTNPSSWRKNPELTKKIFAQTKKILKMEMQTYRDAMQGTSPYGVNYQGNSQQSSGNGGGQQKDPSQMTTEEIQAELGNM